MNKLLSSFVIGSAVAMVGSPLSALAEQIPMDNPSWGYVLSGLGSKGLDTAYVFTNTTATMSWTAPDGVQSVELLVVGGGGAGGSGALEKAKGGWAMGGGGGGAGGFLHVDAKTVNPGSTYEIIVGAGAVSIDDQRGRASAFDDTIAQGGGCGGYISEGFSGGCGGGGSCGPFNSSSTTKELSYDGGAAESGQGYSGGSGKNETKNGLVRYGSGGGGGGAGSSGGNVPNNDCGGNGGAGLTCAITGEQVVYSAGGGGASDGADNAAGEAGGIGAGRGGQGCAGADATGYGCGGGGGAALKDVGVFPGGKGFQGIVIVRVNVHEKEVVSMDDPTWGYKILGLGSSGHEKVYVFTNTTAQMTWTAPVGTTTAELLVVGGGGAGGDGFSGNYFKEKGMGCGGGGGGAGGYRYVKSQAVMPGQSYAVTVGKGASLCSEKTGGDSTFDTIVAYGGGCGGHPTATDGEGRTGAGNSGGSGGGGSCGKGKSVGGGVQQVTAPGGSAKDSAYGNAGGFGRPSDENLYQLNYGAGGGGGGAGGAGEPAVDNEVGGAGGAGKTCDITGEEIVYAAGGNGASSKPLAVGQNATGYGSGGDGSSGNGNPGGKGFQGVVIVRVYEHEWDWNDVVFSTCTEAGHSNAVCTIEGCTATAHLDIAPLGHDFSGLPYEHVCTRDGCKVIAAVCPTIDPVVYTGAPQKPDLTDEYFDADYGAETYTDAKTYTIKLTPKANTVWSDTQSAAARDFNYTITQAENDWTSDPSVSPDYWKVTAVPDEITIVNGSAVFGTVVCDKTVEDLKKLAAGTHQVNFTVAETANWAGLTKSVAIEIAAGIALDGTLNANTRTVSLNLGASGKPLALVLAYGATDEGGKLWNGWDSHTVLKKIAAGGASQYTYKMPLEGLGDGVKYIRFFLVDYKEPIDNAEIEGMSATFDFIPHVHDFATYVDVDGVRRYSCSDPDCTEKKECPLEYSHLWDYLKGDGVGFLKTDYVPDMRKTRIEMVYRHDDIESNLCFFQANKSSVTDKKTNDDGMMLYYWGGNQKYVTFYNFDGATTVDGYVPDTRKHTISAGKKTVTIDGRHTATLTDDTYLTVQGPMVFYRHLFYYGNDGYFKHSIYSVKIYETENNVETLIHDYVPATKDGQNAGFWDRVENKYWPATSAGFRAKTNGLSITIR